MVLSDNLSAKIVGIEVLLGPPVRVKMHLNSIAIPSASVVHHPQDKVPTLDTLVAMI